MNELHQLQLSNDKKNPWLGHLFLPPCSCYSSRKCTSVHDTASFDFDSFDDLSLDDLFNVSSHVNCNVDFNDLRHIKQTFLCKKYSLTSLSSLLSDTMSLADKVKTITSSELFSSKIQLLIDDMKLLFPLSGSKFHFKGRNSTTQIKLQITCSNSRIFVPQQKQTTTLKSRKAKTSRPTSLSAKCPFSMSINLDISSLNWYIKLAGCTFHQHHPLIPLTHCSIGKHQMSTSMLNEINKLHKANVSSSIQQNVLFMNNKITIDSQTIRNKKNMDQQAIDKNLTNAEQLLLELQRQENISYFALYSETANTPLLTVKKPRRSRTAINNNMQLTGVVRVYPSLEEQRLEAEHFDSASQKVVKNLMVCNRQNEVRVLLAVGWARNEDLHVLRKFPEVIKMDSTSKTNSEDRPLLNLVIKDSNNKTCNVMRCLLPSEKTSIFDTLLTNIIPNVIGSNTCQKVKLVITDADSQEMEACQNACKKVFTNAIHTTCLWHMIHKGIDDTTVIHTPRLKFVLKQWLFFTASNIESMSEKDQLITHLKVYLGKLVEETRSCASQEDRISSHEVHNALHWVNNHILVHASFDVRPSLVDRFMFDELTTSNAEAEHSALKRSSLGVSHKDSMHAFFEKANMDASRKSCQRIQRQVSDLSKLDTKSLHPLSRYLVDPIFRSLEKLLFIATHCISKQIDAKHWIVSYRRQHTINGNMPTHFLPLLQRLHHVHLNDDNQLVCSCNHYNRYCYPCHHILHIIDCYTLDEVKKEWFHIRWTKEYAAYHYEPTTDEQTIKAYQLLYDNHPIGIHYEPKHSSAYPIYKGFGNNNPDDSLFQVPDLQLMCQVTKMLWIEKNTTNNSSVNRLFQSQDSGMIEHEIMLSQEQREINDFDMNDNDSSSNDESVTIDSNMFKTTYSAKNALLKRANDLCSNNNDLHFKLYDLLENFVISNEVNHNDNDNVFKNRKNGEVVTVSSNKVTNK